LTTFLAVPKVKVVRGQSMFSSSFVYVIFQDGTDLYWARSRVLEYLNAIQSRLPAGAKTRLGPDATGVGWVYQYALEGPGYSPDLRLGIAERDGKGEAVGGVVVMRYGENALRVIDGVKQRIAEIAPALPAGVRIVPTYDRSDLIHGSIKTLWRTLLEESVIVALVCAVFLLHARSALVAMAAAALLSVTLVPALMGWFVKGKIRAEAENPLNRWAIGLYRPLLQWALRARWLVLGGAAGVLLLTVLPLAGLGSEFMPPLNEGSLMYMPNTLPALSLTTQRRLLHVEDSILMTFPEVVSVWGKAGRANTATDWAPMSMVETVVNLKPESEWRRGMTQDSLIGEMDRRLRLTGAVN